MWTDGSTNSHTNFAADSGLEADHCCIKVEIVTTKKMISLTRMMIGKRIGVQRSNPCYGLGQTVRSPTLIGIMTRNTTTVIKTTKNQKG